MIGFSKLKKLMDSLPSDFSLTIGVAVYIECVCQDTIYFKILPESRIIADEVGLIANQKNLSMFISHLLSILLYQTNQGLSMNPTRFLLTIWPIINGIIGITP